MEETDTKAARRAPWPEKCKLLAMEKYIENQEVLNGKFKGCGAGGVSADEKDRCWQAIADSINAISDVPVNVSQVKKQVNNIRQRANEKLDQTKKTGGGRFSKFTDTEKLWIESSSKKAPVHGLTVSLDTEGDIEPDAVVTLASRSLFGDASETLEPRTFSPEKKNVSEEVCNVDHEVHKIDVKDSISKLKRKEKKIPDLERENLLLDNKRIKLDIERIQKETVKIEKETLKTEKETLKIQNENKKFEKEIEKMDLEIGNLKLKRSVLELSLARAAEEPFAVSLLGEQ
ncbi:myosin-2-like [Mercenaria mercenaria]|uniref:myosin-2-like n=1 Tax=Mercenaria mercenaria TaxID=6596 RepID=UPI00234E493E|nr:myosin-2-like [Mercenaria mercenaria]